MVKITVLITVFAVTKVILAASPQLPCNSQLRPVRPDLFKHCETCAYSQWSAWKIIGQARSKNCTTGKTFKQIRTRHDINSICPQQNETTHMCQPTIKEKAKLLIGTLDLGLPALPTPEIIKELNRTSRGAPTKRALPDYCPSGVQRICNITRNVGKRDTVLTTLNEFHPHDSSPTILHDDIIPEPFKLDDELNAISKHHRRQRRMTPCCNDRYVLFILDTSGSVGHITFKKLVESLSKLVPLFCKNTKIAAMTYGSHIYHEFCFNCFESDDTFRTNLRKAMSSIPYHGGYTHTGRAIQCACDEILTTACGLPTEEKYKECPAPIDVVILTDGRSNGPLDVCKTAKCLHNQAIYDVNTFAIGVKNFNQAELDCIVDQNDLNVKSIFYMDNFKELESLIKEAVNYLVTPGLDGKFRTCYNPNKLL